MHKLVSQVPSGWFYPEKGPPQRRPCAAGDITSLIYAAPYELRFNELSMEVQLDGEHVTSEWMETAYVEFQEQGWKAKKKRCLRRDPSGGEAESLPSNRAVLQAD